MTMMPLRPRVPCHHLVAVLAFICPLALSQSQSDLQSQIASAIRNQDYSQALELLGPALRQSPGDAQLWTMQGVTYDRQGDKKQALASFEHALKVAPNTIPALEGAVQIEFAVGDQRAIPLLQRLLRLRPEDSTSHGMLAVLEYQRGNCDQALPHFRKAESLFQDRAEALHAYAICLVKLKQPAQAAGILRRSAELKSGNPQELRLLASVELMAHQPEAALAVLQPLLSTEAPDAEALELASSAYEGISDTEKAVDTLRRAILLQPTNPNLYVEFATLAAAHQSFQVGINVVNDGLKLQPSSAALYFARGMLYAQRNQYENAQEDFDAAYRLDPNQSLTAAAQGIVAVQQSDFAAGLKTIEQKLARKPDDAVLLYLQADLLTQQGVDPGSDRFKTALGSAKRSVALNPALAPAHAVLGRLYFQSQDYPGAIHECQRALQLNPKDEATLYRLIQAMRKTEQAAEVQPLVKHLAELHAESLREEQERGRYRIVEGEAATP